MAHTVFEEHHIFFRRNVKMINIFHPFVAEAVFGTKEGRTALGIGQAMFRAIAIEGHARIQFRPAF